MFEQLPRYAKGLAWRLGRLQSQLPKDQKSVQTLEPLEQQWREIIGKRPSLAVVCEPVCAYHWMLEEFRVSLFAQQLGTKMPVSEKRLTQQWDKVKQWVIENPL
jgi:ATP-dependent helicase HrpA